VFGSNRLVMMGVAGDDGASAVLTVTSTGTSAVYFRWATSSSSTCERGGSGGGGGGDEGQGDVKDGEVPDIPCKLSLQQARFYLSDRAGVILPGEVREFVFTFRCPDPGVFSESWSMATTPPLPSMGMHHRAGAPVEVSSLVLA
jgi:hypothetical protein